MNIKILLLLFFINFSSNNLAQKINKVSSKNYTNISSLISLKEFEKNKEFILKYGDRLTYRNFDNANPHYKFLNCDVFMGADIGQKNINNDPKISDFNQLTITDWDSDIRYYELLIVRKGDIKAGKDYIQKGMKEQHVYLVDVYDNGLGLIKKKLSNYLNQIKKEIHINKNDCK